MLAPSACLRIGYEEARSSSAADGGIHRVPDASGSLDGSVPPDAASGMDAATRPGSANPGADAAYANDAASQPAPPDASSGMDASLSDAALPLDAAPPLPDAASGADAAVSCNMALNLDYCVQLPALPAEALLDGTLDCGPALIELPAAGWNSKGTLPSDNHARYAVAWRPDGLYFYVEVDDPVLLPALESDVDPWCGDGVEVYVDNDGVYSVAPDYDNPGTIQLLATSPASDPGIALAVDALYHTRNQKRAGNWDYARHVSVVRDGGYALEAFVTAADLGLSTWQLASGGSVGFDLAINVSTAAATPGGSCGDYLGQYYLRLSTLPCTGDYCRPYSNVAAFCTPTLQ